MRATAYSINSFEKEYLAKANKMNHDISLRAEALSVETTDLAAGTEAVLVFTSDDVSASVINALADLGIKYVVTRSTGTDHIDLEAAENRGIKVANVPSYSPQAIAEQAVMLALALSRKLVPTSLLVREFDFTIEKHIGFNFHGKTVGLIGLGSIGKAAAAIFNGLGCHVLAYDIDEIPATGEVELVTLDELFQRSDIISLHAPLNAGTRYMINKESISKMKDGVMLINTARGGLINTKDALFKLEEGKIGYLGLDVYEFEKGLFFEDHRKDLTKDLLIQKLIAYSNVIVTPHQGFLTHEALEEIAQKTMDSMDLWQSQYADSGAIQV